MIAENSIVDYFLASNLLNLKQHDFHRFRFGSTCLFDFSNLLTSPADLGIAFAVIYLDMPKPSPGTLHLKSTPSASPIPFYPGFLLTWPKDHRWSPLVVLPLIPDMLLLALHRVAYQVLCYPCV